MHNRHIFSQHHINPTYREMQKVRIAMLNKFPFFGRQAMKLQMVEDPSETDTMCTDGEYLWYNSAFVNSLTKKQRVFVMAHEVMHIISLHHTRMKPGMDHQLWNIAADYVINLILADIEGLTLPEEVLYDKKFEGMSTEKVYAQLKQELNWGLNSEFNQTPDMDRSESDKDSPDQSNPSDQQTQSDKSEKSEDQESNSKNTNESENQSGQGQDQDSKEPNTSEPQGGQGQDQSSDSNSQDQSSNSISSQGDSEIQEEIKRLLETSKAHGTVKQNHSKDKSELENEVKVDVALTKRLIDKSKQIAPSKKVLPEQLQISIEAMSSTDTSWQRLLANFLNSHAQSDWNWMVPDARYSQSDFIFPSLYSDAMSEFVIAIDTSGSIDREKLTLFIAETNKILNSLEYDKVHVIYCADYITGYNEFQQFEEITIPKKLSSGGTDYRPVWEFLNERHIHPRCLIYFTDLEVYSFEVGEDPGFGVLWILFNSQWQMTTPPFGTIIEMEDEGVLYNVA